MSHTIELKKVSKYYAANDSVSMGFSRVDLDLDMGEFVAITGESGSGKSTLLNVISGLDTYEEGEMFVFGEDTTGFTTEDYERYRKTYIGNIFQDFNLINSYSVYQNIELVMLLCGKKKKECMERVNELIELVGLSEFAGTKVSKLSGGQKQRVAIARALAKDAPIIVADEPTGNLDSESAAVVMETLAKVSRDKLVVIVTHNYEQVQPYVTRKLTMHDGRVIEDVMLNSEYRNRLEHNGNSDSVSKENETDKEIKTTYNNMGKGSEIRLGLRNTFNIPSKLILLLIIYLFVATAVLGQYASTKNSIHENDLLGNSPYFLNQDPDRIVISRHDKGEFSQEDILTISQIDNITTVFENDIAIDKGASAEFKDILIEGPVYPAKSLKQSDLTYGKLPSADNEIVLKVDSSSDSYNGVKDDGEELLGTKSFLRSLSNYTETITAKPVFVSGIIIDSQIDANINSLSNGYSVIYVSDAVGREAQMSMMAEASDTVVSYAGKKEKSEELKTICWSNKVKNGQAYISEMNAAHYANSDAVGKYLGLEVSNMYFKEKGKYTVSKVFSAKNMESLLGLLNYNYDEYSNCIFISKKDYYKLFDKGTYQVSAFMDKETKSDDTVKALKKYGYDSLLLKDTLSDMTGGFGFVINIFTSLILIAVFLVLFFITYAVIKLIMKSRNTYYSTLRILGGSKKNTDNVLKIELVTMMMIAYLLDVGFVVLVKNRILQIEQIEKLIGFLAPYDYVILGVVMFAMSLLVANRYSRKIFTQSAMRTFREEA